MAWTQADLDALKTAYASGVRAVTLPSGLSTQYGSLVDMRLAIQDIQAEVRAAAGTRRLTPRHQVANFRDAD